MNPKRLRQGGSHIRAKEKTAGSSKKKTVLIVLLSVIGVVAVALGVYLFANVHAPEILDEDVEELTTRTEGVYTFLLIGTDKGGGNTDTIMVVTFDASEKKCSLVSIPRDTMVNVRWDIKKINSVYSINGVDGLKEHVKKLLGFAPDHYVKIKLQAFVDVVDAMGGVTFDVPRTMDYDDPVQDLHIHLKKGTQKLDGMQAMGLVRWRHNNDYTRGYSTIERDKTQQAFLKTMAKQCLSVKNWDKISDYVKIFSKNVESDLTVGEMLWLAKAGMSVDAEDIHMFTLPGIQSVNYWSRTYHSYQSYILANADENLKLVNEYLNPYKEPITKSMLDVVFINADGSLGTTSGKLADSKAATPPVVPREISKDELAETDDIPDELTKPFDGKDEDSKGKDGHKDGETGKKNDKKDDVKTPDDPKVPDDEKVSDAVKPDEKSPDPLTKEEKKTETETKTETDTESATKTESKTERSKRDRI